MAVKSSGPWEVTTFLALVVASQKKRLQVLSLVQPVYGECKSSCRPLGWSPVIDEAVASGWGAPKTWSKFKGCLKRLGVEPGNEGMVKGVQSLDYGMVASGVCVYLQYQRQSAIDQSSPELT